MNISHALTEFFYARDLTKLTHWFYEDRIGRFIAWCAEQGVTDTERLDKTLIRRFNAHLAEHKTPKGTPLASHTRFGYMGAVRAFVNFCIEEGFSDGGKVGKVKLPKLDQKVITPFTKSDIDKLLVACRNARYPSYQARDRAIVTVLLDTGIRANELCSLTLDRVTFSPTDAYIVVNGKGRKQRQVWLGKESRLSLHRYIYEYRPDVPHREVFISHQGTPYTVDGLQCMLTRLRERAKLTVYVNPHRFRHTFAYWYMATKRGDVLRLSRILGHSSVSVTEHYLRAFGSQDAVGGSLLDTLRDMR